jgi:glucosamine-6-phosphate deaminase
MCQISRQDIVEWCRLPVESLPPPDKTRIPYRIVSDSQEMALLMARELVDTIIESGRAGNRLRVILPCGPSGWEAPFRDMVVGDRISLRHVAVFHMDDCLDANCRPLHPDNPFNFRSHMDRHFYGGIPDELSVPQSHRHYPTASNIEEIRSLIADAPIDLALGGWGPDGHVAYNQAARAPFAHQTLHELRNSETRIVANNPETILSLAHRNLGAAYYLVPPYAVTLGMKEILGARKIRLFSDTGTWKQTAFRVALFAPPSADYPMTLLQEHRDTLLTCTRETADHPLSHHPEWDFGTS